VRVAVLGAGVVGVSTAWYLAKAGHSVEIVDRQPGPGLETSFANGGQISACHAEPWAHPGAPKQVLAWMGREDAPLIFRWTRWDPALWAWGLRFLSNCTESRTRRNTERVLRIALYSRDCLRALRAETGIAYDERTDGILHFYRSEEEFGHAKLAADVMSEFGLKRRQLSAGECLALEPALAGNNAVVGGFFTDGDESGDAHVFTRELAALAAGLGVTFRYGVEITSLAQRDGRIVGAKTSKGDIVADAYVLALASYSPFIARTVGLSLPIYPAKGYSATVTITNPAGAPRVSVTDDAYKVVFSRLGDRLRIAGTAEMAGWDTGLTKTRTNALLASARRVFPKAGDYDNAQLWTGLRPSTPDYVPILGPTKFPNLFLNTGHGTLGWTMACGSVRLIADLVSGKSPTIATEGLGLERF
jgi:D-amino-acid dehydrogenase